MRLGHQDFVNHKSGRSSRLAAFFDSVPSRSIIKQSLVDIFCRLIGNILPTEGLSLTFLARIASPNQIGGAHRRAIPLDNHPEGPTFRDMPQA